MSGSSRAGRTGRTTGSATRRIRGGRSPRTRSTPRWSRPRATCRSRCRPDDYIELLPARWQAVNAYGIKVNHRTYDGQELNPLRQQPSGVKEHKNLWEIHHDPYDVSRIWVRDHWNGGWITVFWTQLHRVAAPFGELAWDHARRHRHARATEEELADAVTALLRRAGQGPADAAAEAGEADPPRPPGRRPHQGRPAAPVPRSRPPGDRAGATEPRQPGNGTPARRGDPDADLRSLRRGGQAW